MRNSRPKDSIFNGHPSTGIFWEEWFINKFGAKRPSSSLNTPADFIWDNETIDLKVAEIYRRKRKRGKDISPEKQSGVWNFNRNRLKDGIDFFICIGLRDGVIDKVFKIPPSEFPKVGVCIGVNNSKYDRFIIELPL